MSRITRRTFVAALTATMALPLAACAQSQPPASKPAADPVQGAGAKPASNAAAPTSAPAQAAAPVAAGAATAPVPTTAPAKPAAQAPAATSPAASTEAAPKALRIGYQKGGSLIILKSRGTLDTRLKALGTEVSWVEFQAGPPLLEALNANSLDFGTTGAPPPVFAQASQGSQLVYAAYVPPSPAANAIVIPKDSTIKSVADLKGKKVAVAKASSAHYTLVVALESVGLKLDDVEPTYLLPPDARAAFDGGQVAAWVIWDPFLAAVEDGSGAKILIDGTSLPKQFSFFLSRRQYADQYPAAVTATLEEIRGIEAWLNANRADTAKLLSADTGVPEPVWSKALGRRNYEVHWPLTPEVIEGQQKLANVFTDLKLVPDVVKVQDAVWAPKAGGGR